MALVTEPAAQSAPGFRDRYAGFGNIDLDIVVPVGAHVAGDRIGDTHRDLADGCNLAGDIAGDDIASGAARVECGRHGERVYNESVGTARIPYGSRDSDDDQQAYSHQHDLHGALHLIVEAAPAQVGEFVGVLLFEAVNLQFGQPGLAGDEVVIPGIVRRGGQTGRQQRIATGWPPVRLGIVRHCPFRPSNGPRRRLQLVGIGWRNQSAAWRNSYGFPMMVKTKGAKTCWG